MILALVLSLALAEPAPTEPNPPKPPPKPAAATEPPIDANGVPAWAKRRRLAPVQNCETRPNIGVETWRQRVESSGGFDRRKLRPPAATCR